MKIGTRSLLFGAHQFLIHIFFIAIAWWCLFGFPWDPRLWCAFIVHDWGYWGCRAMDSKGGQYHPALGGLIMGRLFGREWAQFTSGHSRFFAELQGCPVSRLCAADKLATALEPWWLYLPRVMLSGELAEYMTEGPRLHPAAYPNGPILNKRVWFRNMADTNRRWVSKNAYLRSDIEC